MKWISIDFGANTSSAAIFMDGIPVKVHPQGMGVDVYSFPSVAFITEKGQIRVCTDALAWKHQDPSRFIMDFKPDIHQEQLVYLQVTYRDIISEIFQSIKKSAETMLEGERIEGLVMSIPNQYAHSDPRIDILKEAALKVGFTNIEFIKEALASAYYYDSHQCLSTNRLSLIYDMGELSFSCSLVEVRDGKPQIAATATIENAGGKYIDEHLFNILKREHPSVFDSNEEIHYKQLDAVATMCRDIKERLTELDSVSCPIPLPEAGIFEINRSEFEKEITPLLEKSYTECDALLHSINKAWEDVGSIILTGGSSSIPFIKRLFNKYLTGLNVSPIQFYQNKSKTGGLLEPFHSVSLGGIVFKMSHSIIREQHAEKSLKERALEFFRGTDCRKNWLKAADLFYRHLLENDDEECYNNLLAIYQTIIENIKVYNGTLTLAPILTTIGEDAADLLVEYLIKLQERYDMLGFDSFVEQIYHLNFWIAILESINNNNNH